MNTSLKKKLFIHKKEQKTSRDLSYAILPLLLDAPRFKEAFIKKITAKKHERELIASVFCFVGQRLDISSMRQDGSLIKQLMEVVADGINWKDATNLYRERIGKRQQTKIDIIDPYETDMNDIDTFGIEEIKERFSPYEETKKIIIYFIKTHMNIDQYLRKASLRKYSAKMIGETLKYNMQLYLEKDKIEFADIKKRLIYILFDGISWYEIAKSMLEIAKLI